MHTLSLVLHRHRQKISTTCLDTLTHTHTHYCMQMHKHSQAVFSVSALPLAPSGPPPLIFTPQDPAFPAYSTLGLQGMSHIEWGHTVKPTQGTPTVSLASATWIVCKQTLTLNFSVHPRHLSEPGSKPLCNSRDVSINVYFLATWRLDGFCFHTGKAEIKKQLNKNEALSLFVIVCKSSMFDQV